MIIARQTKIIFLTRFSRDYLIPFFAPCVTSLFLSRLEAYGFPKDATESDIVARLFKMYQDLTTNPQR